MWAKETSISIPPLFIIYSLKNIALDRLALGC